MTDFSYQLYSSRNFPPLADTLRMLASLGYAEVEGFGGLFTAERDAAALRDMLDEAGLRMPTCHVAFSAVRDDPESVIAMARTLGLDAVFAPYLDAAERPSDAAGWRDFGAMLDRIGAPLRDAGLKFGWHNHDFEFVPLADGTRPFDHIMAGGPGLAVELDVAWVVKGGSDPAATIDAVADRLVAAHVKDIAPAGQAADEDGWADVGHGTVDWPALLRQLRGTGCRHFVMEHDNPNDHERFARRSIAAVQGI